GDGTARISELIWVERKRKYFCKRGLTRFLKIRSDLPVGHNRLGTLPWGGGGDANEMGGGGGAGSLSPNGARVERSPHPVSHFRCAQCEPTLPLQGRVKINP